jgi:hypothetical protein
LRIPGYHPSSAGRPERRLKPRKTFHGGFTANRRKVPENETLSPLQRRSMQGDRMRAATGFAGIANKIRLTIVCA